MKRTSIFLLLAIFFIIIAAGRAGAKVYIDLQAPAVKKLPVAVQGFKYTGPDATSPEEADLINFLKEKLSTTLVADLTFSGLFEIIPKEAFLEDTERFGLTKAETDFSEWRVIGADTLIKAGFSMENDRLVVDARFFDSVREVQILGKRYIGKTSDPGRLVHYFADQIYEEITGRPGVFSTKLLFVSDRSGNKEIYLSDYDGKNTMQITRNGSINLSPRWAPDGKSIYYTSYKHGEPATYRLNLLTGQDVAVSKRPGINIGARPSPDGATLAITLSIDRSPQIYLLELKDGHYKRLTRSWGIDVSPTWSPDGKKLAFVSDRAGNPHIFMLDLSTGKTTRLTFGGKYNASPTWSPDEKHIAFARSDGTKFNIWVMRSDGSEPTQLTYTGDNRNPSWSPDGRFIVFSSTRQGVSSLHIMHSDGSGMRKIETGIGGEKSPAWSPFSR